MSVAEVFQLIATALSPTLLAFIFHIVIKKSKHWDKINYWVQQLLIGIFFALLAMCSFYFGVKYTAIPDSGKTIVGCFGSANASPMIAGLVFGGPSGLIAGFLGSIFRLFMYGFGTGDYLRVAECVTILLTGILSWLLRKGLFDDKKPKWGYGIIIGIVVETIHMIIIFITGIIQRDVNYAYAVIRQCDIACGAVVVAAITLSLLSIAIFEKEKIKFSLNENTISSNVQRWLIISFCVAIIGASLLTYFSCSTNASVETHQILENAARDAVYELETSSFGEEEGWTAEELKTIAFSRRVRNDGCVIISGKSSNYDGSKSKSPFDVKKDQIYSISADLIEYVEKEQSMYYFKNRDNDKKYDIDSLLTSSIDIDISLSIPDIKEKHPELISHKCSPMFRALMGTSKDNVTDCVVLIIEANVLGSDNDTITQKFYVTSAISLYESRQTLGLSLRMSIYIELLVFAAIFGVIYIFIRRAVVTNIRKVNDSLEKITEGDLSVRVNVRSNKEFASLSDDINITVDTLKQYIEEAKKRMEQELVFAKTIQKSALPYMFPTTSNYDLYADMKTAKQVGGDFYDFIPLSNNRLFFMIADVSGKGVPAAMFMMKAETLIKSLVQTDELSLDQIIANVNDELCNNNDAQMFVTAWCGILDINTGHIDFVNAGHNPPLVKHKGENFNEIRVAQNLVLAAMENVPYRLESIDLNPGDEIIIYTDGVSEATNKKMELYTVKRLLNFINTNRYTNSKELIDKLKVDLDLYQKDVEQADDITVLMIRYKPND